MSEDKKGVVHCTILADLLFSYSKSYFCSSRSLALQKLWRYCMSVVSGSVLRWSVVITRVGNPGWGEIAGQCCHVYSNAPNVPS